MGKVCRYCGTVIGDNDRFCENCGAKYEEVIDNSSNNSINEPITYGNNAQQSVTVNSNYEKEELQEGVAATGTAVEELEYLLENCGFMNPNRWNLFQTFMQEMQVIQGEIDNLF